MTAPSAEALAAAVPEPLSGEVTAGRAEVVEASVAGAARPFLWHVNAHALEHPMGLSVVGDPEGGLAVANDDQAAFVEAAAAAGLRLRSEADALGYVRTFLEATRGPSVLVSVVDDAAGIAWRPGTDAEESRRAAVLAGGEVRPPSVTATADGYRVEVVLVVQQRLQATTLDVTPDGAVQASFRVIADELPLPIAL